MSEEYQKYVEYFYERIKLYTNALKPFLRDDMRISAHKDFNMFIVQLSTTGGHILSSVSVEIYEIINSYASSDIAASKSVEHVVISYVEELLRDCYIENIGK